MARDPGRRHDGTPKRRQSVLALEVSERRLTSSIIAALHRVPSPMVRIRRLRSETGGTLAGAAAGSGTGGSNPPNIGTADSPGDHSTHSQTEGPGQSAPASEQAPQSGRVKERTHNEMARTDGFEEATARAAGP